MSEYFVDDFQLQIFQEHYADGNENIEDCCKRQAAAIMKSDGQKFVDELFEELMSRRIVFGGRVTANVGTGLKNVFAFNCYGAHDSTEDTDSIRGIYSDLLNTAEILKTEGGCGMSLNSKRPRGTIIKGVGVGTPGVVAFMELFDKSADIITRGNIGDIHQGEGLKTKKKIRKGAMLSLLDIRHPEIVRYIEAKKIPNYLTRFNMSVGVTDSFMEALTKDESWDLWFPDVSFEKYSSEWRGDFDEWEEKGYPKVVYETVKASDLWTTLIKNMYNRNEPGIYFIDNANRYNNLRYYQKITVTNPCLTGDTLVTTDRGMVRLDEIVERFKRGEDVRVLTYNVETGEGEWEYLVNALKTREDANIIKITFDDGEVLRLTPDHLVYTEGRGYVEASQLTAEDVIIGVVEE